MSATNDSVHAASSSPFVLDSEMSGLADLDFDIYESDPMLVNASLSGDGGAFHAPQRLFSTLRSPSDKLQKDAQPDNIALSNTAGLHQTLSAATTASPRGSSLLDSSSESSRHKRKSSSESSHSSALGDVGMLDNYVDPSALHLGGLGREPEAEAGSLFGGLGLDTYDVFNDEPMDDKLMFSEATVGPSQALFKMQDNLTRRRPPMGGSKLKSHRKFDSQNSMAQAMGQLTTNTSREASPFSPLSPAFFNSKESSPMAMSNASPSPGEDGLELINGRVMNSDGLNSSWSNGQALIEQNLPPDHPGFQAPLPYTGTRVAIGAAATNANHPILSIYPVPFSNRVEKDIQIILSLYNMPPNITKMHLQKHSLARPKFYAKPPIAGPTPDTLELSVVVVCTSSMRHPEKLQRAFQRAAEADCREADADEDPLEGGEVQICDACLERELKRVNRKKVKKPEEERLWREDEHKRIVMFNSQEVREWQATTPNPTPGIDENGRLYPVVRPGTVQVDLKMRIACYCRHCKEKAGFQAIFTLKDWRGNLVAQAISYSIMITDDHKSQDRNSMHSSGPDKMVHGGSTPSFNGSKLDISGSTFDIAPAFVPSKSTSDLQNLKKNSAVRYQQHAATSLTTGRPLQTTSATMTPHNMSRQASPSVPTGPTLKKRKASGPVKIPSDLTMTRMEHSASQPQSSMPVTPSNLSCFSPSTVPVPTFNEHRFSQTSLSSQLSAQYGTNPPTPNGNETLPFTSGSRSHSLENLPQRFYSTPSSAHLSQGPSRAPSPNGIRMPFQQAPRFTQLVGSDLYHSPANFEARSPPQIHKMVPKKGPMAGGIEVTCLGSGFYPGLEVMFGETKATTTTYWAESTLVCLLPPAEKPGTVAVTFIQQLTNPSAFATFTYIDDDDQELLRHVLRVLGNKLTGTGSVDDSRAIAQRIIGADSKTGYSTTNLSSDTQQRQRSGIFAATLGMLDLEATLLRLLDIIDLDDSPNIPRLNLRTSSGQTMLHLACSLGCHRFVAALLARGANPEPRDKGGFTPMHMAALHDHAQIIRRLMLSGADPTIRSLQGFRPADMTTSDEVICATHRFERHARSRSAASSHSRTSSARSLRSLWEPDHYSPLKSFNVSGSDGDSDFEDDDDGLSIPSGGFWLRSRRPSIQKQTVLRETLEDAADPVVDITGIMAAGLASPATTMIAIRDQLTAQIHHLQQTMHLTLPNFPQMPTFANLPDYQAYLPTNPMVRRISTLVGNNRPNDPKEQDYKWWALFSSHVASEPPAYDELFPETDGKQASTAQGVASVIAEGKCAELFKQQKQEETEAETSHAFGKVGNDMVVRIGHNTVITHEMQELLRKTHAEKRLQRDWTLFCFWIPVLIILASMVLYHRAPGVWVTLVNSAEFVQNWRLGRSRLADQGH